MPFWADLKQWLTFLWNTLICFAFGGHGIWYDEERADRLMDSPAKSSLFAELSAEIILSIANNIEDRQSRVLFSLSCKRLRNILTSYLNLSLSDRDARIQFLQIYERDLPDHLTCRSCGRLFEWRVNPGRSGYRRHSKLCSPEDRKHQRSHIILKRPRTFDLHREVVDLILKVYERGEDYGLPISVLNGQSKGFTGGLRSYTARVIGGELFLAVCWTRKMKTLKEAIGYHWPLLPVLCPHKYRMVDSFGDLREHSHMLPYTNGLGESDLIKCLYCRTQYRSSIRPWPLDSMVELKIQIWMSFGTRYDNSRCSEQMFRRDISSHVVVDELAQRDLQVEFQSG